MKSKRCGACGAHKRERARDDNAKKARTDRLFQIGEGK